MKDNVWIAIDGRQEPSSPHSESVTLYTSGCLVKRGGSFIASYDESDMTGMEKTRTEMEISDGTFSMSRMGKYPSQIVFEKGKRLNSFIDTENGLMDMTVSTPDMSVNMTESGGTVEIKYDLEIEHSLVGGGRLRIDIRKLGE